MPQEDAASFSKTLDLGRELAQTLPDNDILSRWMAHHIADLLTRAESATGEAAQAIRQETATTILALWAQRTSYDSHDRPLAAFKPVFKALERLSAPQKPWHFYRPFDDGVTPEASDVISVPVLSYALELEDLARRAVTHIVRFAAREALYRDSRWLELSAHLPDEEDTRAARALRDLLEGAVPETSSGPARDAKLSDDLMSAGRRLVAELADVEADLRTVRLALEQVFADGPAESP